jgi:hypothetical protein
MTTGARISTTPSSDDPAADDSRSHAPLRLAEAAATAATSAGVAPELFPRRLRARAKRSPPPSPPRAALTRAARSARVPKGRGKRSDDTGMSSARHTLVQLRPRVRATASSCAASAKGEHREAATRRGTAILTQSKTRSSRDHGTRRGSLSTTGRCLGTRRTGN